MGLIEDINKYVIGNPTYDDSLSSLIKEVMDSQLKEEPTPQNYYYITHVTNPAQTYHSRQNPGVKKPPAIARKLAYGKQLHNYAGIWFKNLPDYFAEEGLLDGAWVDIFGVRGKIDQRFGDSLLELKTKDSLPESNEEIFSLYPHDLEQIAFYSVIHPKSPKNNYLVFMKNSKPFEMKAFKIGIKDKGTLKTILLSRISLLDEAFKKQDSSKLGQCRYYKTGCQYHDSDCCACKDAKPLNIDPLQRSVEISYDDEFTKQLEDAKEKTGIPEVFCLSTRDILVPRKHYLENVIGYDSTYMNPQEDEFKACLWSSIGIFKRRYGIELEKSERQSVVQAQRDPRARIGFRWMKIKSSVHREGEIVPYIEKVSMTNDMKFTKPSQYHMAEIGLICSLYGKSKGLIIRVFPNLDKRVMVHQVTLKNHEEIFKKIKGSVDAVEEAERTENLLSLPACPKYMNDGGKCPLMDECNVKGVKGCK
jgi:hypothetical protein